MYFATSYYIFGQNNHQTPEVFFAGQACSGISFLGTGGQGFFLPGHMGGGLVLGLTVISVEGSFQTLLGCVPFRQRSGKFQDDVSP